jgi:hypothetical protein
MPRVGFERTIPAFELAKTVHVSERAAAVVGFHCCSNPKLRNDDKSHVQRHSAAAALPTRLLQLPRDKRCCSQYSLCVCVCPMIIRSQLTPTVLLRLEYAKQRAVYRRGNKTALKYVIAFYTDVYREN